MQLGPHRPHVLFRLHHTFRIEPEPTFARAEALYLQGRSDEALGICRALLAGDPASFRPLHLAGVICLDRADHDLAAAYLRRAEAVNADDARLQYHLGTTEMIAGRTEVAMAHLAHAVRLDPTSVDAVNNLGTCHRTLGQDQEAMACFERALQVNPDFAPAHYNLGLALARTGRAEEALSHFRRAAEAPIEVTGLERALEVRDALANALMMLGKPEEALEVARARTSLKPDDPTGPWHQGLILLSLGRLAEGWPLYERRWDLPGFRPEEYPPGAPLLPDLGSLDDADVLLRSEQGHGDTIQFARYAALVKQRARSVTLSVRPELRALMSTLPWADMVIADSPDPPHDVSVHLMSLPLVFGTEMPNIPAPVPYLSLLSNRLVRWRERLGERTRPRIGIAWYGSQHIPERTIPLSALEPLLRQDRFAFHSLQKETPESDRALMRAHLIDHSDGLEDFADTAALI